MSGIPKSIIRVIVGNLHVGESHYNVVKNIGRRIRNAGDGGALWTKARRRQAYRFAIAEHERNRKLYGYVMGGLYSRTGPEAR